MPLLSYIKNFVAPSLPVATKNYDEAATNQFAKVLRLYFNRLDNLLGALSDNTGGAYLQFPNGAFHQNGSTTLTASMTNVSTTPISVVDTTDFLSSGALLIGTELVQYTGKTSTSFTGITRGAYSSSQSSHAIGVNVTEAQPVPSSTTSLALAMTTTDVANEVSINTVDNTKIDFNVSGYYNVQFSVQMLTFDSSVSNCTFWFRKNGTDVANSAGIVSVPSVHGGVPGATIVSWNIVLPVETGEYLQLMMASDTGNVVACTYPAGTAPVHPVSPSVILTATFVSALY